MQQRTLGRQGLTVSAIGYGAMGTAVAHPSLEERQAKGREARDRVPLSSHAGWRPAADRPDPVALLQEQDLTREPNLVPVRHGRMMVSPFTFYRGAAKIMAADLKDTPVAVAWDHLQRWRPARQLILLPMPSALAARRSAE